MTRKITASLVPLDASATSDLAEGVREKLASELVERLSLWSGAAGLIPVPLVDMTTVGGVQLYRLRRLSEIYKVPFSKNWGKSILASIVGAVISKSAAITTTMGLSNLMKVLPGIGVIGAVTMPVVAAAATWMIGKVFIKHFASGGTLLDFNPADYREFIKSQQRKIDMRSESVLSVA
jgi:uncharacterized protein (DUF697 family)